PLTLTEAGRSTALAELHGQPVLHWHGDQFDLPTGLSSLASTPLCPHQAFAPHARALALQFHPEVDPARLEQWLIGHGDELVAAGIRPHLLRDAVKQQGPGLAEALPRWMGRWLDQALL
ncbi:MAG TPA: glutamine amidotransferase, partial [Roseateles sp.]|nr:glutamine amidotransferase [Roseateles sp.]